MAVARQARKKKAKCRSCSRTRERSRGTFAWSGPDAQHGASAWSLLPHLWPNKVVTGS